MLMNLSKSRYTQGVICPKKLWLSCYKIEEAEDREDYATNLEDVESPAHEILPEPTPEEGTEEYPLDEEEDDEFDDDFDDEDLEPDEEDLEDFDEEGADI